MATTWMIFNLIKIYTKLIKTKIQNDNEFICLSEENILLVKRELVCVLDLGFFTNKSS